MKLPYTMFRARHCTHILLFSAFLMLAAFAAAQGPPASPRPPLTSEARSRLTEAAQDAKLEPWQREFMLGVARGNVEGGAAATSPTPLAFTPPLAGVASSVDGDWTGLTPPAAREFHTAIYDPVRDRMVVFGGEGASGQRNDVWALSLAENPAWSELTPAGSPPAGREGASAIWDPVRDRMVVFGGYGSDGGYRNDVWALSVAGSPAWSELTPAGTAPSARELHTAIYDPVRDRMVVFGGLEVSDVHTGVCNDVWALSFAGSPAWSALAPEGTPPSARDYPTAIYDPVRDRMVVFGGFDIGIGRRNDVWALSLAGSTAWSKLTPLGTPPSPRYGNTTIYDPVRDRLVVFGGSGDGIWGSDVWELSLAGSLTWSALATAGGPPSGRYLHTAIYDPVRDRMVMFAGSGC